MRNHERDPVTDHSERNTHEMSTYTYGTLSGSSYGITFNPGTSEERPKTPSGLIVTQAVQTREGWLGQVIVDKEIVWEGGVSDEGEDAIKAANARVVEVFKTLFGSEAP
jgi:hypothetical protein